jgi:transcriptional regulator with XRE-family HTH domain|nr:MAG TPA: repressor protein [Caudoviricetes sp.]
MNCVERVKAICKERKIPISKLESDLKFSNGYIGQLRKGVFPADRLAKIASYLEVSSDYLLTGEETKKAPTLESERKVSDDDIKFALFGGDGEITDAMYDEVKRFAQMVKLREEAEKEKK